MSLLNLVKAEANSLFKGKINLLKKNKEFLGHIAISGNVIADATDLTNLIYSSFDPSTIFIKEPEIVNNILNLSVTDFEKIYLKCADFYTNVMKLRPDNSWKFLVKKSLNHPFLNLVKIHEQVESVYNNSPFSPFETTKYFIFFKKKELLQRITT